MKTGGHRFSSSKVVIGTGVAAPFEPAMKFLVVGGALRATVGNFVIAEIEWGAPAARMVRFRTVRQEAAENGRVSRVEGERNCARFVDQMRLERVILAIGWAQAAVSMMTRIDDGAAILGRRRVERYQH